MTQLTEKQKAERYDWLVKNAGNWSANPDNGTWYQGDKQLKIRPMLCFAAYSTAYHGRTLDDALTLAMKVKS